MLLYRSPSQDANELAMSIKNLEVTLAKINKESPSLVILILMPDHHFFGMKSFSGFRKFKRDLPWETISTCIDLIFTNARFSFVENGVMPSIDPMCKH